jgi:hypothetical protein
MRTQLVEGACPILDNRSEHKHEAYLQWFDGLIQSARLSEDEMGAQIVL